MNEAIEFSKWLYENDYVFVECYVKGIILVDRYDDSIYTSLEDAYKLFEERSK